MGEREGEWGMGNGEDVLKGVSGGFACKGVMEE